MYIYAFIILITIYILYFGYYKLRNPFWSRQPVFHYHNIHYWLFPPGILLKNLSSSSKFLDKNVNVIELSNDENNGNMKIIQSLISNQSTGTTNKIKYTLELIKSNYLHDNDHEYNPEYREILTYLIGHNEPCFLGNYVLRTRNIENGNINKIISHEKIISSITSRPLYVTFEFMKPQSEPIITQYVDFLVTHKKFRKKGYTPKLIYSFAHEIINTPKYKTTNFLFKNEDSNTSIVPFVTYHNYIFDTTYWSIKPHDTLYKLTKLNSSKFSIIQRDYKKVFQSQFKNMILPSEGSIQSLLEQNVWNVFILHYRDDVICYYFFRNHEFYYKKGKCIECFASVCMDPKWNTLFVHNFYNCIDYLKKNENIKYIHIENISNNNILLKRICREKTPLAKLKYNYYFYNNVVKPVLAKDTIILN
jgi:hypothetical protein